MILENPAYIETEKGKQQVEVKVFELPKQKNRRDVHVLHIIQPAF